MSVLITNDDKLEQLLDNAEIEHICAAVLAHEGVKQNVEISVSFVGDAEMQDLNNSWRDIDHVTDVLSFENESLNDPYHIEGEPFELGDIILDPDQIARQAPGFGNTPQDECRLMLVHGMLHLLGYDHIEDADAEVMEAREDEILRALAVERQAEVPRVEPTTRHTEDAMFMNGAVCHNIAREEQQ